jgi:hypothetical protein
VEIQTAPLPVPEFVALTNRSLATIAGLEKYRGNLYNWYDTQTLRPLGDAPFISSVDSGNLIASLYTLRSGTLALLRQPLLGSQLFSGLRAHLQLVRSQGFALDVFSQLTLFAPDDSPVEWIAALPATEVALTAPANLPATKCEDSWWLTETRRRVRALFVLLQDHMPWLLPEYEPLRKWPGLAIPKDAYAHTINEAIAFGECLQESLIRARPEFADNPPVLALGERLRAVLPEALQNLRCIVTALRGIADQADGFLNEADLGFLVDPGRQILSIGYDVCAQKLHDGCYDIIASEARVATFLAIARDEIPAQSWFKLGREHTRAFGRLLLYSWTGTMFEYLMPALWLRSYPETLITRTLAACVQVQRSFALSLNSPWGISESGTSRKDDLGHYQYRAYGVPQIALWIEATAGPVISPYSSFLALSVDSLAALRNLRRMDSFGWVGAYGYYEAADYSTDSSKPVLVREWMAHHQGMSLLAILNLLHDEVVQRWFHANPEVKATELLLHEMPFSTSVLRARLKE